MADRREACTPRSRLRDWQLGRQAAAAPPAGCVRYVTSGIGISRTWRPSGGLSAVNPDRSARDRNVLVPNISWEARVRGFGEDVLVGNVAPGLDLVLDVGDDITGTRIAIGIGRSWRGMVGELARVATLSRRRKRWRR